MRFLTAVPDGTCTQRLPARRGGIFVSAGRSACGVSENGTRLVMDGQVAIQRALVRIAHEILERNKGTAELALVGIRSRGVHIAQRIQRGMLHEIEGGAAGALRRRRHHALSRRPRPRPAEPGRAGHRHPLPGRRPAHPARRRRALHRAARSAPRWTRSSTSAGRSRSSSPCWSTAAIASCRSAPTTWARTSRPRASEQVQVRLAEADGVDEVVIEG